MLRCRSAAVVTIEHLDVVGIRAEHRDLAHLAGKRQYALVFQKYHGLGRSLHGLRVMLLAADDFRAQPRPREHSGRVEHSQFEAGTQCTAKVDIQIRLLDETLLEGVDQGCETVAALKVGPVQHSVC